MENNYWYLVGSCKGKCKLENVGIAELRPSPSMTSGDIILVLKCKKCGLPWGEKVGVYSKGSSE